MSAINPIKIKQTNFNNHPVNNPIEETPGFCGRTIQFIKSSMPRFLSGRELYTPHLGFNRLTVSLAAIFGLQAHLNYSLIKYFYYPAKSSLYSLLEKFASEGVIQKNIIQFGSCYTNGTSIPTTITQSAAYLARTAAFSSVFWQFTYAITQYVIVQSVIRYLIDEAHILLTEAIQKDIQKEWIDSGAYYGNQIAPSKTPIDQASIVTNDVFYWVFYQINLIRECISMLASTALALDFIYPILNFQITTSVIALITIIKLTTYIANKYQVSLLQEQRKIDDEIRTSSYSINNNASSIHIKGGSFTELKKMHDLFSIKAAIGLLLNRAKAIPETTSMLKGFSMWAFGIWLSRELLTLGKKTLGDAQTVGDSIENLLNFFTWSDTHTNDIKECEATYDRIATLQNYISAWSAAVKEKEKNFKVTTVKETVFSLKGTVWLPNGTVIFGNNKNGFSEFKLTAGQTYLLSGKSGTGKSTFLKAIAGIWPWIEGEMTLPKNTQFIPQKPYIPEGKVSLMDIILYPSTETPSEDRISKVKDLLKLLGFNKNEDKYKHLYDHLTDAEWKDENGNIIQANYAHTLSGGEAQRIAFIAALFKQPQMLIMDEATSAIDFPRLQIIEPFIKESLKESIILYTSHFPTELLHNQEAKLGTPTKRSGEKIFTENINKNKKITFNEETPKPEEYQTFFTDFVDITKFQPNQTPIENKE